MAKNIKTKEVVKDIKIHETAGNTAAKVKDIGVKTKETVDDSRIKQDNPSVEQYAADKVTDEMRRIAETAIVTENSTVKKGVEKVKKQVKDKKAEKEEKPDNPTPEDTENLPDEIENTPSDEKHDSSASEQKYDTAESEKQYPNDKKRADSGGSDGKKDDIKPDAKNDNKGGQASKDKKAAKEKKESKTKTHASESADSPDNLQKPRQKEKSSPKTKGKQFVRNPRSAEKNIKTIDSADKKIRQSHRSQKDAKKAIKTAEKSAKTAEQTAKTAKKSAEATAKAAKKAEEIAKVTARKAAKAVKITAQATVKAVKAAIAAVKELVAAVAAGGTTAVVVIVVICLLAAIGGTCFGIFLANDKTTGSEMTITQAISALNAEHYEKLTSMEATYSCDTIEVQGNIPISWKDLLAVYAVKTTTSTDNPMEVVTIDDDKLDILRNIVSDMNIMTGKVTTKTEEGEKIKVLTVTVTHLSADEAATLYNFDTEQKAQLSELMSAEYDSLWKELIGGSGDILSSNSSHIPKDIFAWPLQENGNITSYFGTRSDPFTGEIKTHSGTDIAMPHGSPILASVDGTVVAATWNDSYGYYVKIQHNDTYSTLYAHCSALLVSAGQQVKQGQVIAQVGSTGNSTGAHLHFEVIQNGVRVDALDFFN